LNIEAVSRFLPRSQYVKFITFNNKQQDSVGHSCGDPAQKDVRNEFFPLDSGTAKQKEKRDALVLA
jgi:hypothetical protein